jgi:hypothetical protein
MSSSAKRELLYISGSVGIAGAVMQFSGPTIKNGTAGINRAGIFQINGLTSGIYTLTPVLEGTTFVPASRVIKLNSRSLAGITFTPTL